MSNKDLDTIQTDFKSLFKEEGVAVKALQKELHKNLQGIVANAGKLAPLVEAYIEELKEIKRRTEAMRKEAEEKIREQHREQATPKVSTKLGHDTPEPE